MKFTELLEEECNDLLQILVKKNSDYSKEEDPFFNLSSCERNGISETEIGMLIRMSDKFGRLTNLLKSDKDCYYENISDTITDLAGYCVLLNLYIKYGKSVMQSKQ